MSFAVFLSVYSAPGNICSSRLVPGVERSEKTNANASSQGLGAFCIEWEFPIVLPERCFSRVFAQVFSAERDAAVKPSSGSCLLREL